MNKKLITTGDVAQRLGVSIDTVKRIVDSGDLRARKIGTWLRFDPLDVEQYLEESVTN